MPTHAKKNRFVLIALAAASQAGLVALAQNAAPNNGGGLAPAPAPAPAPANSAGAQSTVNENATEIDSSTSQALKSIFETKPEQGTAGKAVFDIGSAISDKIKAVDVLKTPGLDDPALRARFETYLSLKEVQQARIDEYFGKMKRISAMLTRLRKHATGGTLSAQARTAGAARGPLRNSETTLVSISQPRTGARLTPRSPGPREPGRAHAPNCRRSRRGAPTGYPQTAPPGWCWMPREQAAHTRPRRERRPPAVPAR